MKIERIGALCHHLGFKPSDDQVAAALYMSKTKAESHLRDCSKLKKEQPDIDALCMSMYFWTKEDIIAIINNRGLCKRALEQAVKETIDLIHELSKHRNSSRCKEDILQRVGEIVPEKVTQANADISSLHHPDQGRLF